jgi:hypothetical protein
MELGRVRARIDDGIALRHGIDKHPEPRRDVVVHVGAEAERIDRGHHSRRVRGLYGDRRSPSPVDLEHGALGLATGNGVAGALFVYAQQTRPAGGTDPDCCQECLQVPAVGTVW